MECAAAFQLQLEVGRVGLRLWQVAYTVRGVNKFFHSCYSEFSQNSSASQGFFGFWYNVFSRSKSRGSSKSDLK